MEKLFKKINIIFMIKKISIIVILNKYFNKFT